MPSRKSSGSKSPTVPERCQYVASSGRRCRTPASRDTSRASGYSAFCLAHAQMEQQYLDAESVSRDLLGRVYDFRTNYAVNDVLGRLFELVAQNRIPLRNANTLAYICQLLLTSSAGLKDEYNARCGWRDGERFLINHAVGMIHPSPTKEESRDKEEIDQNGEDDEGGEKQEGEEEEKDNSEEKI